MSVLIDITGKSFGRLRAVRRAKDRNGELHWRCRCSCGKVTTVSGDHLRSGHTRSCGCLHIAPFKGSVVGQQFQHLTVIKQAKNGRRGAIRWVCRCACKRKCIVHGRDLKNGSVRSCGYCRSRCIDLTGKSFNGTRIVKFDGIDKKSQQMRWLVVCPYGEKHRVLGSGLRRGGSKYRCICTASLSYGEASFNKLFGSYKQNARYKGISFRLSKPEFRKLTKGNCFYCGIKPSRVFKPKRSNGEYIYNGVDRLDSDGPYRVENCVSCCKVHNEMKMKMSANQFVEACEAVVNHYRAKGKSSV